MTDHKNLAGLKYGQAGSLVYVPRANGAATSLGQLHTSRRLFDVPTLQITSPWEHCYSSSQHSTKPSASSFSIKRVQKRWISNAHPETVPALACITDILNEESALLRDPDTIAIPEVPPFELGMITDLTAKGRPRKDPESGIPVIAKAAGNSGELLHILRLQNHWYHWPDSRDVSVRLKTTALLDKQEEVFWSEDVTPIQHINFATDLSAKIPRRWLIVQKASGTTILQPEHHDVPVPVVSVGGVSNPSRINPRKLVHISYEQTGGRIHSDVAFAPTRGDLPAQLAIIDEMGFWSVYNLRGQATRTHQSVIAEMVICGQITLGVLQSLNHAQTFEAMSHGTSFCEVEPGSSIQPIMLLAYNREDTQVVKLDTRDAVMMNPIIFPGNRKSEYLVDIQRDPSYNSRLFILTSMRLIWLAYILDEEAHQLKPKILISMKHFTSTADDVQMTLTSLEDSKCGKATLTALYSNKTRTLKALWFRQLPESNLAELYQRDFILQSPAPSNENEKSLRDINVCRLSTCIWGGRKDYDPSFRKSIWKDTGDGEVEPGPATQGNALRDSQTVFHQIFTLTKTGQIGYWLAATAPQVPKEPIDPPPIDVFTIGNRWAHIIQARKKAYQEFIMPAFVVPDGCQDYDQLAMVPLKKRGDNGPRDRPFTIKNRIKRRFLSSWANIMERLIIYNDEMKVHSSVAMDRISAVIQEGFALGELSNRTLLECLSHVHAQTKYATDESIWAEQVRQTLELEDKSLVIFFVSPEPPFDTFDIFRQLQQLITDYASIWVDPRDKMAPRLKAFKRSLIGEIARDTILASTVISISPQPTSPTNEYKDYSLGSSQNTLVSSQLTSSQLPQSSQFSRTQSQLQSLSQLSQKKRQVATARRNTALENIRRLSQYTTISLTHDLSTTPSHTILASWPKESGISTDTYITPKMRASMVREEKLREKQEAIEARRKKQAAKIGLSVDEMPTSSQMVGMGPLKVGKSQVSQSGFIIPSSQSFGLSQGVVMPMVSRGMSMDKKKKKKKGGIR